VQTAPETSREDLIVLLASVPERAADLTGGIDAARLGYRHGPAFPNLQEVLHHLCQGGPTGDAWVRELRAGHAAGDDVSWTQPWDVEDADPESVRAQLDDFARLRRRTVDWLRGLPDADWEEVGAGPEGGQESLSEVCQQLASHELGHLVQLRNLIALLPD